MAITFFFYLFALTAIASAVLVVTARNPVHSVLFLILCFFNAAGLFVLLGAEFLAMILVVVYVGAVAVLFLFVVMMLDVDFEELRSGMLNYLPIGGVIGLILAVELILLFSTWNIAPDMLAHVSSPQPTDITNTQALGEVLYTKYVFWFHQFFSLQISHTEGTGVNNRIISGGSDRQASDVYPSNCFLQIGINFFGEFILTIAWRSLLFTSRKKNSNKYQNARIFHKHCFQDCAANLLFL